MRLLSEEGDEISSQNSDQELALSKGVDALLRSMEEDSESSESKKERHREYEHACREKCSTAEVKANIEAGNPHTEPQEGTDGGNLGFKDAADGSTSVIETPIEEQKMLSYQRKVTVLYELLSACLAGIPEDKKKKCTRRRKGYDARHRVALRLLATWLDFKWRIMVCMLNL